VKRLLRRLLMGFLNRLPPDKVLRFLFRLDNWLYYVQGQMAIAYGGGLHTKHRHMNYHDFFVGRIQPNERVMDIGCGLGAVAFDVAERAGARVVGIDINAKSIAKAKARYAHPRVEYRLGDVLQMLPERPFDAVILSNVLEHLPDRPQFLQNVQQRLRPTRFLIRVPLFERDWRVPLKKELGVEYRLDPTHEIEYTRQIFQAEMNEAGLAITHQEICWGEIWAELVPKHISLS
jgi:2-polyprenyl-3-methyl-5-hydroxy-6-metoxy-1,4-benzoquinol methylase